MLSVTDYMIGWICATRVEYAAATAFLDEIHKEFVSPYDNNQYLLGEAGKHNVVIAASPHAEYGTSSAAVVAIGMMSNFPNIRIGLMVGIGGGAPSPTHDIRLGDVVVAAPRNGDSGLFQYDFGRVTEEHSFQYTPLSGRLPSVLRSAIALLRAQHESDGHGLEEAIKVALEKNPRLRKNYSRPDAETDRLYRAEVIHNAKICCANTTSDNTSMLIHRLSREEEEESPAIHYGSIASANQIMKDAFMRDRLSMEKDILCFEMEAAGLMANFSCLVIRGICDYSDTHQNKDWQGYAAITASAYTKDLIRKIPPQKIEAEKKIRETIKEVYPATSGVSNLTTSPTPRIGIESLELNSRLDKLRTWLLPPDPSFNFERALEQRCKGSGGWFLRSTQYQEWKQESNSFLWLNGFAGSGKTILSSSIIEDLDHHPYSDHLLYFYFDFTDIRKQSFESLVCSLVFQLYYKNGSTRNCLDALYSSCEMGKKQPVIDLLCSTFQDMLQETGGAWIVLDALDECQKDMHDSAGLFQWIQSLRETQINVHFLLTSRPELDIRRAVEKFARKEEIISLTNDLMEADISSFIEATIRSSGLRRWESRPDIRNEIESHLKKKANGMFRWVSCQLHYLETCIDPPTVRRALMDLPETLEETFNRVLENIPHEYSQHTKRILQFLIFSERPLQISEVVDIIAVDTEITPYFDPANRLPISEVVSKFATSFVSLTQSKSDPDKRDVGVWSSDKQITVPELRLAHESVKEYFTLKGRNQAIAKDFEEAAARASIAEICLAYLLGIGQTSTLDELRQLYPMAQYSAQYWASHAAIGEGHSETLRALASEFFSSKNSFETCLKLHSFENEDYVEVPSPLYYASWYGLAYSVSNLIHAGADVNALGKQYGHALQAASFRGHYEIVKLLVQNGADLNAQGGQYGNALQAASYGGYDKIVELLVHEGADVNAQGGEYGNVLQAAVYGGHDKIVKLLVYQGANVNAQGGEYGNALQAASFWGHDEIVKLLVQNGAVINAQGGQYGNALQAASNGGYDEIVKLLVQFGADINVQGGEYGNALQAASFRGHEQIVKLLVQCGADVNAQSGEYGTALQAASYGGYQKIVQILLDEKADVNVEGGLYGNALHTASSRGAEGIVQLLLADRAKVELEDNAGWTPLSYAAQSGHESVVRMLLEKDVNIEAKNHNARTALSYAVQNGHAAVAQLLIERGADINTKNDHGQIPLSYAAQNGHSAVVELLLESGADFETKNDSGKTPLLYAAQNGYLFIVSLLLRSGADVETKDKHSRTSLSWAAQEGDEAVVVLLLQNGAEPDSRDIFGQTPLWWAARYGHDAIVQLLLKDNAADPNAKDNTNKGTPLWWAAQEGHDAVVQLLINTNLVDLDSKNQYGQTALSRAAQRGHDSIVALLLAKSGVDCNSTDTLRGRTPLSYAAGGGYKEALELLLKFGAKTETRDLPYERTPLSWAAENGHAAIVERLLSAGSDPHSRDRFGRTPLSRASEFGHEEVVQSLLATNIPESNHTDTLFERTPLSWAAENGHEKVVDILLTKGRLNPDHKDKYGHTPLCLAAENGYRRVCELLYEVGVDLDSKDTEHGRTPLSWAAGEGHELIVVLLLGTNQVDANSIDNTGRTPLSWASMNGHGLIVTLLLNTSRVDADSTDNGGRTPLSWGAGGGHEPIVTMLLCTNQVNADSADYTGRTPLSWASMNGHGMIVTLLLDTSQVDADSTDDRNRTPLSWAAGNGHAAVVEQLLKTGKVNVSSKATGDNGVGRIPLSWATENGHEATVKLLLDANEASANAVDDRGRTPIFWAAENGHETIVRILLGIARVNADSADNRHRTPLSWAAGNGHAAVVEQLLKTGKVNVNSKTTGDNGAGRTPLSWAAENGHEACVRLLLDTGEASANSIDDRGRTPLSWAAEKGREAVAKLLLDQPEVKPGWKDFYGRTPLSWAIESGFETIAALLYSRDKAGIDDHGTLFQNGASPIESAMSDSQYLRKTKWSSSLEDLGAQSSHSRSNDQPPTWHGLMLEPNVYSDSSPLFHSQSCPRISSADVAHFARVHRDLESNRALHPVAEPQKYFGELEKLESELIDLLCLTELSDSENWSSVLFTSTIYSPIDVEYTLSKLADLLGRIRRGYSRLEAVGYCQEDFSVIIQLPAINDVIKLVPISSHCLQQLDDILSLALLDVRSSQDYTVSHHSISNLGAAADYMFSFLGLKFSGSSDQNNSICHFAGLIRLLSLGLISYAGSHASSLNERCGRSHFEITINKSDDPTVIFFYPTTLACLKGYIGGPVWVFSLVEPLNSSHIPKSVLTSIRSFTDLWGPARIIYSDVEKRKVSRIQVERGIIGKQVIQSKIENTVNCHWYSWEGNIPTEFESFDEDTLMIIGTRSVREIPFDITPNADCQTQKGYIGEILKRTSDAKDLGVLPDRWDIDTVNFNLGISKFAIANLGGVIKKFPGRTRKGLLLMEWQNDNPDPQTLSAIIGLEISACTGNALRLPLWELFHSNAVKEYIRRALPNHLPKIDADGPSFLTCFDNGFEGFMRSWTGNEEFRLSAVAIIRRLLINLAYTGPVEDRLHAWFIDRPGSLEIKICDQHNWLKLLEDSTNETCLVMISRRCLQCNYPEVVRCGATSMNLHTALRTTIDLDVQREPGPALRKPNFQFGTKRKCYGSDLPAHSRADLKDRMHLSTRLSSLLDRGNIRDKQSPSNLLSASLARNTEPRSSTNNIDEISSATDFDISTNNQERSSRRSEEVSQGTVIGTISYVKGYKGIMMHIPCSGAQDEIHAVKLKGSMFGKVGSSLTGAFGANLQWYREVTGYQKADPQFLQVCIL